MKQLFRAVALVAVLVVAVMVGERLFPSGDNLLDANSDSAPVAGPLSPVPSAQAQELPDGTAQVSTTLARRSEEEQRTIEIYKRAEQAVVFITTITLEVDPFDVFPEVQQREGSGSGIIVDAERGIVITNLHVIQDAHKIEISLVTGQTLRAKLLGMDEAFDVAVLQLISPPKGLVSLPFADSARIEVGQRVLAIGNPFGLDRTLTAGIVSSVNRTVKGAKGRLMRGLIQTDAAINPGNSGGPLLDMEGRLIGMNSAILSQSGDSAGIGFAVPINQIRRVLPELIATGKVLRPQVGWILVDTTQGPMVRRVMPGSAAEESGVQPIERAIQNGPFRGFVRDFERADLVYRINGSVVRTREEVENVVAQNAPGRALSVTVRKGGINGPEREITITPQMG